MPANRILHAEPGQYQVRGSASKARLAAAYTGRSIDVEGRYPDAKSWLQNYEHSPEGDYRELEQTLLDELPVATDTSVELFRGRWLNGDPSPDDFAPPRDGGRGNRYNDVGVPALYLCSSTGGVKLELADRRGKRLWMLSFRLPACLRLACARQLPVDSLAAALFWLIESARDPDARPRLGHRVGALLARDFDGLLVPGVRGELEQYWNAVLFRPVDRWSQWVAEDAEPESVE